MKLAHAILGCAGLLVACDAETLAVGSPRCQGQGVRCELPTLLPVLDRHLQTRPLSYVGVPVLEPSWVVKLPCFSDSCDWTSLDVIANDDGSISLAGRYGPPYEAEGSGVWLARYGSDGAPIWTEDDPLDPGPEAADSWIAWLHVAQTGDGARLYGVIRVRKSDQDYSLWVYRGDNPRSPRLLFHTDEIGEIAGLAELDGDVVVAAIQWNGDSNTSVRPELVRFAADGRVIWRQAELRPIQSDWNDAHGFALPPELLIDADGIATVAVSDLESGEFARLVHSVIQITPDGNVLRATQPGIGLDPGSQQTEGRLALDGRGRVLLGENAYTITRVEEWDTEEVEVVRAIRDPDAYFEPLVFGLAADAEDRVLIPTQTGARSAQIVQLDRLSESMYRRESFELTGLSELHVEGAELSFTGVRVGSDQGVYLWNTFGIARFDLPEPAEDAMLTSTPGL